MSADPAYERTLARSRVHEGGSGKQAGQQARAAMRSAGRVGSAAATYLWSACGCSASREDFAQKAVLFWLGPPRL